MRLESGPMKLDISGISSLVRPPPQIQIAEQSLKVLRLSQFSLGLLDREVMQLHLTSERLLKDLHLYEGVQLSGGSSYYGTWHS